MIRCWLTGASSGIGAALALHLLEHGHSLVVSGRQREPLEALRSRFPDRVVVAPGDIGNRDDVAAIGQVLEATWGAIDLAILNAGTCEYLEPGHFDAALLERVLRTNLIGLGYCLEVALPLLHRGSNPHLVVTGSSVDWLALPRAGAYGASKAAVRYLMESLRIDLASAGIDVTLVSPGFVDTPLTRRNDFPMPQLWSAQRAARHIAERLAKRPLQITFPTLFILVLRLLGALPGRWRLKLGQRMARREQD
ncbi:SDR family NAD(P)-dependent oxidoreductase [Pseudomonas bharatica]|uniref:SDR family NAD(P)-dependent oxidoreductase n=1 Tax=Pseudomonas bharatica TaxID=2692112 RepID=UPI003B287561